MGLTEALLSITDTTVSSGRRVVCVVCPEIAAAVDVREFVVVAVPGARVLRPDGDLARGIALAAGSVGGTLGGAGILVVGHEDCIFRAPSFAVPGPAPPGESFPTMRDLVRHSVRQLQASPWVARTNVRGAVVATSGAVEEVRDFAGAGSAPGAPAPGPAQLSASGPVSFFGGTPGAATNLGSSVTPIAPGAVRWESPPPIAPGGVHWESPPPIAPAASTRDMGSSDLRVPVAYAAPSVMPSAGPMPSLASPLAAVTDNAFDAATPLGLETSSPPPPPKPAPPKRGSSHHDERRPPAPPPTPPPRPPSAGDDPFARAEEILERLRRERKR